MWKGFFLCLGQRGLGRRSTITILTHLRLRWSHLRGGVGGSDGGGGGAVGAMSTSV